jgi:hypothetical protein
MFSHLRAVKQGENTDPMGETQVELQRMCMPYMDTKARLRRYTDD